MARIFQDKYRVKRPDGTVEVRTCKTWTVEWRDENGKLRHMSGSREKRVAQTRLGEVQRRLLRNEPELLNPFDESLRRPIGEHVAEYLAQLQAEQCSDLYIYNTRQRLARMVAGCGWKTLKCIERNGVNSFLTWRERFRQETPDGQKRGPGRLAKAPSAETLNQYLDVARAFLNWCASTHRLPGHPNRADRRQRKRPRPMVSTLLDGVGKVNGPEVRKRRALTEEQVAALLSGLPAARALVYRFAFSTGLRRGELRDLQWRDVNLSRIPARVELRAEATKADRPDKLDLPQSLADALRQHRPEGWRPMLAVFEEVPSIETWKEDLAAAGIDYKDEEGRQADFHGGIRKTLCTRMARAGVPLSVAMQRMRHTDSRLTLVDYTDTQQLGQAVLPEIEAAPVKSAEQEAAASAG